MIAPIIIIIARAPRSSFITLSLYVSYNETNHVEESYIGRFIIVLLMLTGN